MAIPRPRRAASSPPFSAGAACDRAGSARGAGPRALPARSLAAPAEKGGEEAALLGRGIAIRRRAERRGEFSHRLEPPAAVPLESGHHRRFDRGRELEPLDRLVERNRRLGEQLLEELARAPAGEGKHPR